MKWAQPDVAMFLFVVVLARPPPRAKPEIGSFERHPGTTIIALITVTLALKCSG
jgi:hypothetical protein